jgi:DNA-binding XRE family transcriptional regulator
VPGDRRRRAEAIVDLLRSDEQDDLDLAIEEWTRKNPDFPRILTAAERTRALVRALVDARERAGLTQAEVARRMGTTQPAVARLERGEADPRLSPVERYAEVIGWRVEVLPA